MWIQPFIKKLILRQKQIIDVMLIVVELLLK